MRTVKVVMLGDSSCGKTAILERFLHDAFKETQSTIGIDFVIKELRRADGTVVRLQVWDTAGQERFMQLAPSYIRGACVAIIVFDLANEKSFSSLRRWLNFVYNERGDTTRVALVGNKSDVGKERVISPKAVEELLGSHLDIPYYETSALTGENVVELFDTVVNLPLEENLIDDSEEDTLTARKISFGGINERKRSRTVRLSVSSVKYEPVWNRCFCSSG